MINSINNVKDITPTTKEAILKLIKAQPLEKLAEIADSIQNKIDYRPISAQIENMFTSEIILRMG